MAQDPGTVRRVILRSIQRQPRITRSQLSLHVRPYSATWLEELAALIRAGIVTEETAVNRGNPNFGTRSRGSLVYDLAEAARESAPEFAMTSTAQVEAWIASASVAA